MTRYRNRTVVVVGAVEVERVCTAEVVIATVLVAVVVSMAVVVGGTTAA
jgi:hypothetical protein